MPITLVHPRTLAFYKYFATVYPVGTLLMVVLLLVSGLLEGISVITLVPILEIASAPSGTVPSNGVGATVQNALSRAGVAPTMWSLVALLVVAITLKAVVLWLAMRQVGYTV